MNLIPFFVYLSNRLVTLVRTFVPLSKFRNLKARSSENTAISQPSTQRTMPLENFEILALFNHLILIYNGVPFVPSITLHALKERIFENPTLSYPN